MNEKKTSISPKQISKIILIPVLGIIFLGLISMTVYGFSSYRSESEDEGRIESNVHTNNQPDGSVLVSSYQTGEQSSDGKQVSYSTEPTASSDTTLSQLSQITKDFKKEIDTYPEPEDIKKDIFSMEAVLLVIPTLQMVPIKRYINLIMILLMAAKTKNLERLLLITTKKEKNLIKK